MWTLPNLVTWNELGGDLLDLLLSFPLQIFTADSDASAAMWSPRIDGFRILSESNAHVMIEALYSEHHNI